MLNIWLPLISNVTNQGLSDYTFTTSNLTFTDTGKIGNNSTVFSGTNSYAYTDGVTLGDTWSVGCLAKVTSVTNKVLFQLGTGGTPETSQFGIYLNSATQLAYFCNKTSYSKTGLSLTGWNHYFLTYDSETLILYINGVQVDSKEASSALYPGTRLTIGSFYTFTSANIFNGSMNDFRLYDTALSAREVREIAKGLVIHYTLATPGNNNLLKDSRKNYGTASTAYLLETYQLSEALTANTQYTISAKILTSTEKKTVGFYFSGGTTNISGWMSVNSTSYYSYTFTATSAMASNTSGDGHGYISVYVSNNSGTQSSTPVTGNASVEWIKLEKSSIASSWCPNVNDDTYTSMGYDNKILYDTSGFKKNGTLIGNPTWTSDTPRYEGAYNFSGSGMYATISGITATAFKDSYTISIWAKYKDNTIAYGYSNGNRLSLYERNGCFYIGMNNNFVPFVSSTSYSLVDESSNKLKDESGNYLTNPDGVSGTSFLNAWHHYVITGNGSVNKLYIDGELVGSSASYVALTGTTLIINGYDTSTSYKMGNPISDFRLYSTVLTQDEITDLYSTGASLASNGTLLSGSFNE